MRVCVRFFGGIFNVYILAAIHLTFFAAHNLLKIRFEIILQFIEESNEQNV